jgi:hypothetical protein
MALLNRQPEVPHAVGVLMVLALVLMVAVARSLPFFSHHIFRLR